MTGAFRSLPQGPMKRYTSCASTHRLMELPVWTESDELRRFVAGVSSHSAHRKSLAAIDQRFIEYVLALADGVTGRIIDLLRRAVVDAFGHKSLSPFISGNR